MGGGGGRRTGLRKVKAQITIVRGSPNRVTLMKFKGLLRYQKPHVTDNISIYAFAYNVQYADSLYCCLYLNIRYDIQCRITNFLHCGPPPWGEVGDLTFIKANRPWLGDNNRSNVVRPPPGALGGI